MFGTYTAKQLKKTRLAYLLLGSIIAWYETISKFAAFYGNEGTLFKVKDCVIPNPITTPCFWGATAFVIALILAYKFYKKSSKKFEKYFLWFMIACVLFAWGNFAVELRGVQPVPGALIAPCTANPVSPFLSACFFGSILFTLSLISTYLISKKSN
ncbi:hypothetical protein ACFL2C_03150 [Patescibacteria group bacterium]